MGVVHITTREVPDIRVERDKTINWYKGNLQGKTVTHPELGKILFTDKGIDHTAGPRSRAGMEKLMLVRYLKHLIANGKTDGWGDLKHDDRKDDYVQFAIIKNNVLINGTEKEVGCFVGKKADGKTYYDLYIGQNKTVDGLPQFRARANNGLDTKNINQDVPVVNLFIED